MNEAYYYCKTCDKRLESQKQADEHDSKGHNVRVRGMFEVGRGCLK